MAVVPKPRGKRPRIAPTRLGAKAKLTARHAEGFGTGEHERAVE